MSFNHRRKEDAVFWSTNPMGSRDNAVSTVCITHRSHPHGLSCRADAGDNQDSNEVLQSGPERPAVPNGSGKQQTSVGAA